MVPSKRVRWKGYLAIVDTLRNAIITGEFPPGSLFPTERDLCVRFGASRPTIRKSLSTLVDQGWAYRVPNRGVAAGRGILPGTSRNVGVIHAGQDWFRPLFERLELLFAQAGWHLVDLGGTPQYPLEDALEFAQTSDMAGAVVWPYRGYVDHERVVQVASQLPVVALDHDLDGADRVTFDHEAAADLAVSSLIGQGRHRIAITGFMDVLPAMLERYRGYLRAVLRAGITPEPRNFVPVQLSGQTQADPLNLLRRLEDEDAPDGIFVFQESLLASVRRWVDHAGRQVGTDLDLAMTGGFPLDEAPPPGTIHVVYDNEALADRALALLEDRIAHPGRLPQTEVVGHRLHRYDPIGGPKASTRGGRESGSSTRQS